MTMKLRFLTVVFLCGCSAPSDSLHAMHGAHHSHYSGMESRPIKALSAAETEGYLSGLGMSQALAGELNGYPGPLHVIELADELQLSPRQLKETEFLFSEMKTRARSLGMKIVAKEKELDFLFVDKRIDEDLLGETVSQIAALKGELRAVHLSYHLKMTTLLYPRQISRYAELRGYDLSEDNF